MNPQRPRLWCVSELYYPEQGTAAHLIAQIAEGLTADFDVHVLCGQPDYFVSGVSAAVSMQPSVTPNWSTTNAIGVAFLVGSQGSGSVSSPLSVQNLTNSVRN